MVKMNSSEQQTQDWYAKYYAEKGLDRNDLLTNPEVLFQIWPASDQ